MTYRHDGLTRGTYHLEPCMSGQMDCKLETPSMERYDGYRNFQEPVERIVSCIGPRGVKLNESDEDAIWAYPGKAVGKLTPAFQLPILY